MTDNDYWNELMIKSLEHEIDLLKEKLTIVSGERDYYFEMCKSYELWQNRAIERVKAMQQP